MSANASDAAVRAAQRGNTRGELRGLLEVALGVEAYTGLGGHECVTKPGDMMLTDARGVISSVIQGPDERSAISMETRDLLFVTYAPAGIAAADVHAHLEDIERFVRIVSAGARTESIEVIPVSG